MPVGLVVLAEARHNRFADIVFGLQSADGRTASLTPAELGALCARGPGRGGAPCRAGPRAGEGAPSLVMVCRPVAEAAADADDDSLDALERVGQWVVVTAVDDPEPIGAALADVLRHSGDVVEVVDARQGAVIATMPATDATHLVFCAPAACFDEDASSDQLMQAQASGAIALAALVRAAQCRASRGWRAPVGGDARYRSRSRMPRRKRRPTPRCGAWAACWPTSIPELGCRLIDLGSVRRRRAGAVRA